MALFKIINVFISSKNNVSFSKYQILVFSVNPQTNSKICDNCDHIIDITDRNCKTDCFFRILGSIQNKFCPTLVQLVTSISSFQFYNEDWKLVPGLFIVLIKKAIQWGLLVFNRSSLLFLIVSGRAIILVKNRKLIINTFFLVAVVWYKFHDQMI